MKGGSTSQQTKSLMLLLGSVTFVVAIVYGLYISTRDPTTWGNTELIGTIRVVLLFLTAIVFYLIADSIGGNNRGGKGKGKDDYHPHAPSHCDPRGDKPHGVRGYSFGSGANVASVGNDDLTDTS